MEDKIKVTSKNNPKISVHITKGHFATSSAHRNIYIDIFDLKSSSAIAKEAARVLAVPYLGNTVVDLIVYMDGTEILAAYMANELLQAGSGVINEGSEIYLLAPVNRPDGSLIFHQNLHEKIRNKNVVVLTATMSTGATVKSVSECLSYYSCKLVGISSVFTVAEEIEGWKIHALFSTEDIPDYRFYTPSECVMCKEGKNIDALFNSEGYIKL